ncbi:hypothetical protein ZWY2020_018860 [Hordeum vulgare]|nr:hypothetical protein ZWY2020_018860 [Hordeum vulgare]
MEYDILERILDGKEKLTNLPFALLKKITNDFSEEREIGHGGFRTVYKGVLQNGNVDVKRIMNNYTIDEKLFYREVNHKNVVRFLGFCANTEQVAIKIEGKREYIYAEVRERLLCFEYISNGNIQNYITDELRGLEWNVRSQIIKDICEGLHHLHMENHIIHMDLKPANILLDHHMVPKVTDFGLSRIDEKNPDNSFLPIYGRMSKSDIYSLGVIIVELVDIRASLILIM